MMNRTLVALVLALPSIVSAEPLADGKLLLKKRQYKDAIVQLAEAAKTDTTGEAAYCLGLAFDLSGDAPKAMNQYRGVAASQGKRAVEAQRNLKTLETLAADAAAVEATRAQIERASLDGSQRIRDARLRIEKLTSAIVVSEGAAVQKRKDRDAAVATEQGASDERLRAKARFDSWKSRGLASPAGGGRGLRVFATVLYGLSGVGLGASLWYAQTGARATDAINAATVAWTPQLDFLERWGRRGDERLPYTLAAGGGLLLLGSIAMGFGEAATESTEDASKITPLVEAP